VIIPITVSAWPVRACRETGARVWRWMRATGGTLMHGVVAFLVTLAIALLAAIGASGFFILSQSGERPERA
jgi:hypothetical protein